MSLTTAQQFNVAGTSILIFGAPLTGALALAGLNNPNDQFVTAVPLLVNMGTGTFLLGISRSLESGDKASTRVKLYNGGLTITGLGLASLSFPILVNQQGRLLASAVPLSLLVVGAMCMGISQDKGNLVNWKD